MAKPDVRPELLRERLNYDPETGVFTWRNQIANVAAGAVAGSKMRRGYIVIRIDWVHYFAHRLAWLYVHGQWPTHEIDHINRIRDDNRLVNLRDVPRSWNVHNNPGRLKKASGLPLGVCQLKGRTLAKPYFSKIGHMGTLHYLGYYATPEEAHEAYMTAKRVLHEGCTT